MPSDCNFKRISNFPLATLVSLDMPSPTLNQTTTTITDVVQRMAVMMMSVCVITIVLPTTAHAQSPQGGGGSGPNPPTPSPPLRTVLGTSDTIGKPLSKDETIALAVGLAIGIPIAAFVTIGCICCMCNTRCGGSNEDAAAVMTPATSPNNRQRHRLHPSQFEIYEGICIRMAHVPLTATSSYATTTTANNGNVADAEDVNVGEVAMGSVMHSGSGDYIIPITSTPAQPNNINEINDLASSQSRHHVEEDAPPAAVVTIPEEIVIFVINEPSTPLVAVEGGARSSFCFSNKAYSNPYGTGTYATSTTTVTIE